MSIRFYQWPIALAAALVLHVLVIAWLQRDEPVPIPAGGGGGVVINLSSPNTTAEDVAEAAAGEQQQEEPLAEEPLEELAEAPQEVVEPEPELLETPPEETLAEPEPLPAPTESLAAVVPPKPPEPPKPVPVKKVEKPKPKPVEKKPPEPEKPKVVKKPEPEPQEVTPEPLKPATQVAETSDAEEVAPPQGDQGEYEEEDSGSGQMASAEAVSEVMGSGSLFSGPYSGGSTEVRDNYYAELAGWLERYKRYPRRARKRRQQGVVEVTFVINRQGQLLSQQVVGSSGYRLLDREASEMLERASPMPPIPAELRYVQLSITVPIAFYLR